MQDLNTSKSVSYPLLSVHTLTADKYQWIIRPTLVFVVTRLIVFVAAYLAEVAIPTLSQEGYYHVNPNNVFLDVWARWDSGFYLSIVERGYFFEVGQQSSVAFFPLYPLLTGIFTPFVGSTLAAGVLVSNLALLIALIFLYLLTEFEFDRETATRTIFYIAAFPSAFFFSAVYTESTFLMFAVGTMYFARQKLWAWAAIFGMLTAASRIVGVMMFGIVGLEWLHTHGWTLTTIYRKEAWRNLVNGLKNDWANLSILFLIPLGLLSYMIFLNNNFGDPLAFSTIQSAWGREQVGPIMVIYRDLAAFFGGDLLRGEVWYHIPINLGAFFAVVFSLIAIWRRLGEHYALFCVLGIFIPVWSGSMSMVRYVLVLFPFFMMLGWWGKNTMLDRTLNITFSVFLGIFTAIFVNWIFIA